VKAGLTYEQQFMISTRRQLNHIRERTAPKYSKRGRLLRAGVPCEITLEEFRDWVLSASSARRPAPHGVSTAMRY
jgi:hypothetical protein